MIYIRKLIIIVISVFFSIVSEDFQAYATFIVLVGSWFLHNHYQPYSEENLNSLESFSLIVSLSLAFIGMFFLSGNHVLLLN